MKYGGNNNANRAETTWESLLVTANNDFVSVLVLWYTGVAPGSTYAWMFPHTLEKYLKAYLLKTKSVTEHELKQFGKSGHGLQEIWDKYKEISNSTTLKPKLNDAFDEIVKNLDTINPSLRYTGYLDYSSCSMFYFYIVLCSLIRYRLIGKSKYRDSLYGLTGFHFIQMAHQTPSCGYAKTIVRKVLHITLEHAGAFTNMGSVNQMDSNELSISNTAIMQKDDECPICRGMTLLDQSTMIKYYRNI